MNWIEFQSMKNDTITFLFQQPNQHNQQNQSEPLGLDNEIQNDSFTFSGYLASQLFELVRCQLSNNQLKDCTVFNVPYVTMEEFKTLINFYLNLHMSLNLKQTNHSINIRSHDVE